MRTYNEGTWLLHTASFRISCLLISGGIQPMGGIHSKTVGGEGLDLSSSVSCQLLISSSQSGYVYYHHLQAQFLPCGPSSMVPAFAVVSSWEPQRPCWVHGHPFINFIPNPIVVYLPFPAKTVTDKVNQVKPRGRQPKRMKHHV